MVRLPLRTTLSELLLGAAVASIVSLVLQLAIAHVHIFEPTYAPEALASLGSALVLAVVFALLAFGRRRWSYWLRVGSAWVSLSMFTTLLLALPLEATRFYYGGSSIDNGFRLQYMTRMASTPALADMNYAHLPPYYPAGWFWLGGRFANLLGWDGWAAYKPYALTWLAVTCVVAFTLWSVVLRRSLALLAALATTMAGMMQGIDEPYAWPSAAWLAPITVITWHALRRESQAPRWTLVCVGGYVGFAAITYTFHFGFAVLLIVGMAVGIGALRVYEGNPVRPTIRRLFLRLLPIGAVSALVALLVWLPYLVSTGFLLASPRNMAFHYLPEDSAFLPVPMTNGTAFGALCLAGLVWLLFRCRQSDVAAALLAIVAAAYCWFGLSTLALAAKTTLLAFRVNVILDVVLATAGVLGLIELIDYLRRTLHARYTMRISTVACVLGLLGAITVNQGAIGTGQRDSEQQAFHDYYPTGYNSMAQHDTSNVAAWYPDVFRTIASVTGRQPQQNIVLTTDYKLLSFQPYWSFQQETPHYANPLAHYDDRAATVKQWATAKNSDQLLSMLRSSPFDAPNVFVLNKDSGKLAVDLKADSFPQQPNVRDYTVSFDPAVFDSSAFVRRDVGPYAIIARR
jgi:galactan 5-O-arabinofuranosyltransferase